MLGWLLKIFMGTEENIPLKQNKEWLLSCSIGIYSSLTTEVLQPFTPIPSYVENQQAVDPDSGCSAGLSCLEHLPRTSVALGN